MISMAALGTFSYFYLVHALASSRQETMQRREARLLRFIADEPHVNPNVSLEAELHHYMLVSPDTDILEVSDADGRPVYSAGAASPEPIAWTGTACKLPCFKVVEVQHHKLRVLEQVVLIYGKPYRITMAGVIDEHYDILHVVERSFLIFLPLMLLASVAGGFILSHRALEPVDRITRAAHLISIRDLNHRLPVPQTGDELQRLAETWNDLLERLEGAVKRLTQFTSDISHDLRTTVTVMLSTAQLALRRERTNQEYRQALETIIAECQSTSVLLDHLLAAARADMAEQKIEWAPVNLAELVYETCDHLRAQAEIKHQQLHVRVEYNAWIAGDQSLLRRLIGILMDNALKYTGEGGSISASLRRGGRRVLLEVSDTGIGIPPSEAPHIFNRFYRADASISREQGGSGLGLAIGKWIADAHHAEITLTSTGRGGSLFTVSFQPLEQDVS
jgi:heavy metal sensor kinase